MPPSCRRVRAAAESIALSGAPLLVLLALGGCAPLAERHDASGELLAPPSARDVARSEPMAEGMVGGRSEEIGAGRTRGAEGVAEGDSGTDGADENGAAADGSPGVLSERVRQERPLAFNPYVITAHRHNYFLPFSHTSALNEAVYRANDVPLREGLVPVEVKFQVSLKTRLNERDLLFENDSLSFGLTLEAWWQLYSTDLSSPFRETNYMPEIFYQVPLLWGPFGGATVVSFGLEHQSNGQVQGLSRSWNRLYASLGYERGNFAAFVRPWYRLPEEAKDSPDDPEGDDNPDILDFMGHGELAFAWRDSRYEYALRVRGDPETSKGAVIVGLTFPLTGRFRGFVRYFDGYGDSLIDYDHYQRRFGLGVALTNLF